MHSHVYIESPNPLTSGNLHSPGSSSDRYVSGMYSGDKRVLQYRRVDDLYNCIAFGPIVGCIAGGVGSVLADMITSFYICAPVTLAIKGVEGYAVGYLFRKFSKPKSRAWNLLVAILLLSLFTVLWFALYSGAFTFALAWGIHRVFTISI